MTIIRTYFIKGREPLKKKKKNIDTHTVTRASTTRAPRAFRDSLKARAFSVYTPER